MDSARPDRATTLVAQAVGLSELIWAAESRACEMLYEMFLTWMVDQRRDPTVLAEWSGMSTQHLIALACGKEGRLPTSWWSSLTAPARRSSTCRGRRPRHPAPVPAGRL